MAKLPLFSVFKIVLEKKSSLRFLVGTIFSFSFSMAVILCTIGLMDGFELTLKKTLSFANGDIKLTSSKGFFISDKMIKDEMESVEEIQLYSPVLQIESFAIVDETSKGVLIKGIHPKDFSKITGMPLHNLKHGLAIGKQFAQQFNVKVGDYITLAMASSKSKNQGVAILRDFQVQKIVKHGIYEKDMRFIYIEKRLLEGILDYKEDVTNLALIKIKNFENINETINNLENDSDDAFKFEPYWSEFEVLLDAVQIEKHYISLILQLIVIVAVLNIVAFIFYISEIKAQDFFMLRALGISVNQLQKFWFTLLFIIWSISGVLCLGLKELFSYLIQNIPYLKIPGDIYVLSELKVVLDLIDYVYVYGISLIWIFLIGFFVMRKLKKGSVISGLRQEFS